MAGPRKRRPGDSNNFDAPRHDPNADLLGTQFGHGGSGGLGIGLYRLVRYLFNRRGARRHL